MEESWLVVSATTMRALGFTRSNARPGEKAVGALVIFRATDVREATVGERRATRATIGATIGATPPRSGVRAAGQALQGQIQAGSPLREGWGSR